MRLGEAAGRGRLVESAVAQGLGVAADGGERRLELVGDVGDEVPPHVGHAGQLGGVAGDHHGAPSPPEQGGARQQQGAPLGRGSSICAALRLAQAQGVLDQPGERRAGGRSPARAGR